MGARDEQAPEGFLGALRRLGRRATGLGASDAMPQLLDGDEAAFMSRVALLVQPPKPRKTKAKGTPPEEQADGV